MAVTVSGMFGDGKTYFADSPVVIDISGLEWPGTSPFTVVRVEVIPVGDLEAESQLDSMFPSSNAPFTDSEKGYINGAAIYPIRDSDGNTHNALVATCYSRKGRYNGSENILYTVVLNDLTISEIMDYDTRLYHRMVELDSSDARREELIRLCSKAYGTDNLTVIGDFRVDTGGQTSVSFDISSALRAIWAGYEFAEVGAADQALGENTRQQASRYMRKYALRIYTEYISSDDGGVFTTTLCEDEDGNTLIPGGQCMIGGMTEWERYTIGLQENADVSALEHTGVRNGDASTKPASSPERVGRDSITSWVDVQQNYTKSIFYPATYNNGQGEGDDVAGSSSGWTGHAPIVLRDSQDYVDFLFVNRRGAVETCSGLMKEAMDINVETKTYSRVDRPTFKPNRSLMAIGSGGRKSWSMSSGYVTHEWAEWWTLEFLKSRQWWMKYKGPGQATAFYVPVIVEPAKKSINIYDRSKQAMPHVDFTVTLALEG